MATSNESTYLIIGLGNPGAKYSMNRHNIGFLSIDFLAQSLLNPSQRWSQEHNSLVTKGVYNNKKIILAKPQTFMNLSGQAVLSLLQFYKVPLSQFLIIHDDLDMPFQKLRLVHGRGHGGQNGIRHTHEVLGHNQYSRLKCGIGRPPHPNWDIADWVLSNWSPVEESLFPEWLKQIEKAVTLWLDFGYEKSANQVNR